MSSSKSVEYFCSIVRELCKLPMETEWVEFKHNNAEPRDIGEYISALANSSVLEGKIKAYLIWGVDDKTHDIIGTTFKYREEKIGNEELENWLLRLLSPKIDFNFIELTIEDKKVVVLEIGSNFRHPVQFKNIEYIRIGSYKKKLKNYPEKERRLWRIFDKTSFEKGIAVAHLTGDEIFQLIDFSTYFDLLELPLPEGRSAILDALQKDELVQSDGENFWSIVNLGVILFAKNLDVFSELRRKAIRVIHYQGKGRTKTLREQIIAKGYACGFEELISLIMTLVPVNEVIEQALRKTVPMFPEIAIRELVANALIHQDLFITGAGPMVEIFEDRIEITSPGEPIVDILRFVDTPPKSRNEAMASLMRRFRICEERGSGIDKVVAQVEAFQLPAPLFEVPEGFMRIVLFAHRSLTKMEKMDRVRVCYLHSCLKWVMRDYLTNASLRNRFGIEEKNKAIISRYIKEAVEEKMIKPFDDKASRKMMKYVPYWA